MNRSSTPIQPTIAYTSGYQYLSSAQNRSFLLVLILGIMINLAGITTKFFTDDPGLYGLIARNMVESHNYANLMFQGLDWLDKPHFPFWVIALSFKLFGVNTIAYKLPALCFYFMSVIYTYKLGKKFYGVETALIAVLILLTAQHTIMSNTDVRAEPYIMGLLMGSVYHFYGLKEKFGLRDLLLGTLFAGCAVMTKGIYLLIPIGFAIIGDYIFKGDFKGLFQWRWLFAIVLTAIFVLPEIYTLYTQFDLHPEKTVFHRKGVSGIKWFLWDSQFGRFNSTGYIKRDDGSYFFFLHTLLWAFAPWALLLYYSVFQTIKKIVTRVMLPEYVCISGAGVMLFIFSISAFQLPFYTNILFPFFAIITAVYVQSVIAKSKGRFFKVTQYIITGLLIVAFIALNFIFSPEKFVVFGLITLALGLLTWYIYKNSRSVYYNLFLFTCCVAVWLNTYFLSVVYPTIIRYKPEVQASAYVNEHLADRPIIVICAIPNAFPFYIPRSIEVNSLSGLLAKPVDKNAVVLIDDNLVKQMDYRKVNYTVIKAFEDYPQENLTLPFILEKQRYKTLDHFYLVNILGMKK
ncbi:glycosyltransferase family 39 protein [Mucilaginibacter sp. AW1-3]